MIASGGCFNYWLPELLPETFRVLPECGRILHSRNYACNWLQVVSKVTSLASPDFTSLQHSNN